MPDLLEDVKRMIKICEKQKEDTPEYYEACCKAHHELFIEIKDDLESNKNQDRPVISIETINKERKL